jgi:hypothetical protein
MGVFRPTRGASSGATVSASVISPSPLGTGAGAPLPQPASALDAAQRLAARGNKLYIIGCLICGTWVLGPIGAVILLYGLLLMRRAEKAGASIRPWAITLVGGFILVDTSVNMVAWGFDLGPAHDTLIGRSLWVDYGRMVDGAYMLFHNSLPFGGVADHGEKSVQIAMVIMSMPIKLAACFGFLKMKRWGLQWMIISYWMYFLIWIIYLPNVLMDFPLRYGAYSTGVLGFWLIVNVPFLGPLVLLPYLHTVRGSDWED